MYWESLEDIWNEFEQYCELVPNVRIRSVEEVVYQTPKHISFTEEALYAGIDYLP